MKHIIAWNHRIFKPDIKRAIRALSYICVRTISVINNSSSFSGQYFIFITKSVFSNSFRIWLRCMYALIDVTGTYL